MFNDDRILHLQGIYNNLYNAITRPDYKFVVSRYFIDEWLPLLGPAQAWLVVGLRQQCFHNHRRDWCVVDKATLAAETHLSERTIERSLKKQFCRWFILDLTHRYRYRSELGKTVRDKNRYHLLLDEPLSPRHQVGLAALLRETATQIEADDPLDLAMKTISQLNHQTDLTDKISPLNAIPKNIERRTILELVEEHLNLNLADYAEDKRLTDLDQFCANLHNRITQPNRIYVGWQYFRMEWVPLLGHALAWLVIYMRCQCYWDQENDELRDVCQLSRKEMATALGQTPRNLRNLLDNPYLDLFYTIVEEATSSRSATQYQIRLVDEPLVPSDRSRIDREFQRRLQGQNFGIDPENGQLNLFPMLDKSPNRQNFPYGQFRPEKMTVRWPYSGNFVGYGGNFVGYGGNFVATCFKDSFKDSFKDVEKKEKYIAAAAKNLEKTLNDLSIQEPSRSRLLKKPDLTTTEILAWFLYAETQPNLNDPRGYAIKRLLANDSPPSEFIAFAQLDDEVWALFAATAQALRLGQSLETEIPLELVDIFISWAEVYASLDPNESRLLLAKLSKSSAGSDLGEPSKPDEAQTIGRQWEATLAQLQSRMTRPTFDTWLRQTKAIAREENIFVIEVQSIYAKDWLENRLSSTISRTLSSVVGETVEVRFELPEDKSSTPITGEEP